VKVGVLTGGGDCPGLNAVIRAIVRPFANGSGHEIVLTGTKVSLTLVSTRGILCRGALHAEQERCVA